MKRKKVVLTTILSLMFFMGTARAAECSYTELAKINQEAANVKLDYEIKTKVIPDPVENDSDFGYDQDVEVDYLNVSVLNLTDNLYIKIYNSDDKSTKIISGSEAKDGIANYEIDDLTGLAKLSYKVYTSSNTSCADQEIISGSKTLPIKNVYYQVGACVDMPDSPACQKYVTKEVTPEEFDKVIESSLKKKQEEADKKNNKGFKKVTNFIKKNKKGLIIGGSIIVVGVVTTVVVIKKRRSRLI